MFEIKNTILSKEAFENVSAVVGLMAMTAAVTVSTFDFGHRTETKVVLPNQPALAVAGEHDGGGDHNPIRREREETAPHHISYSETQRTASRSGKQ